MSLNQELADLFANLASIMELKGENTFKVIAFQKVSRIIREMNFDLKKCVEDNTLCEIQGIGKTSQQIIEEYINTGKSTVFDEISATIPKGLGELLRIEGLGPKTIHMLWQERNITSLAELKKAISTKALLGLKGIGEKKIAAIEAGIVAHESRAAGTAVGGTHRVGIMEALGPAEEILQRVRKIRGVEKAEIAGSLRRRRETIADVDIVAVSANAEEVGAAFAKLPGVVQVLGQGATKTSVKIGNGMQVDLRVVPAESFGAAMVYFTGSKEHNVKIRGLALEKGWTLNEWRFGSVDGNDAKPQADAATEQNIYAVLGLEFIAPEMREDLGEVEAAIEGRLPRLIETEDYRGDLHTHTTASDGVDSIEAMAEAAKQLGYDYLAITDHSKSQVIANGLSNERLLAHVAAIRKVGEKLRGITLLAGAEVDIMPDGRLDYEPEILKELDIVIASPHFSLKQDEKKATDRLRRAIDARYVNIIGHPTGRLINRREGLPVDFTRLFPRAARNGTAMEINASYPRLDLGDANARAALQAGCVISINTDSHSTGELATVWQGIWVARRAWATKERVLNCWGINDLQKFLSQKR